jgi:hypothetical protein
MSGAPTFTQRQAGFLLYFDFERDKVVHVKELESSWEMRLFTSAMVESDNQKDNRQTQDYKDTACCQNLLFSQAHFIRLDISGRCVPTR